MTDITSISVDPAAAQREVQGQGAAEINQSQEVQTGTTAEAIAPAREAKKSGVMHSPEVMALQPNQFAALKTIMAGRGPVSAAMAANVHRGTLYRWMKEDAAFRAALIKCEEAAREAARHQLLCIADVAAAVVRREVRAGNVQTAMAILRSMGLLDRLNVDPKTREADEQTYEVLDERADGLVF
ncbi:MAG: hypothetical protein JWP03_4628 [Phycisphaerales bacterium]|jgi:hypothetical protein|nr:hypothetical protein [Phycisphaerales bacterium]